MQVSQTFDFAIRLGTFCFEFSSEFSIFVILLYTALTVVAVSATASPTFLGALCFQCLLVRLLYALQAPSQLLTCVFELLSPCQLIQLLYFHEDIFDFLLRPSVNS